MMNDTGESGGVSRMRCSASGSEAVRQPRRGSSSLAGERSQAQRAVEGTLHVPSAWRIRPTPTFSPQAGEERTECADGAFSLTHPRESHLLPLVERLVEVHERGADRGGGGAHGG